MSSPEHEIRELRSAFWSDRDPDGRAFASLADAYRRSGDLDQAIELLEDGLDRHPGFASGHVVAAWVHRDRGALEEAEACFRTVLQLDAENGEALRGLGELAAERGRDEEALRWLNRLAGLEPGNEALARRIAEIEWASTALGPAGEGGAVEIALESASDSDGEAKDLEGWDARPAGGPAVAGGGGAAVEDADEAAWPTLEAGQPEPDEAGLPGLDAGEPEPDEGAADEPVDTFAQEQPAATDFDDLSLDALPAGPALDATDDVRVLEDEDVRDTGDVRVLEDEDVRDTGDVLATEDVVHDADEAGELGEAEVRVGEAEAPEPWGLEGLEVDAGDGETHDDLDEPLTAEVDDGLPAQEGEGVYTRTMAELYARQGLHDRALRVYERLSEREPGDGELRARMEALKAQVARAASAAPAPDEGAAEEEARRADEEIETLARDWAEGAGAADEVATPFAWSGAEEEADVGGPEPDEPVAGYFGRLLSWEPGSGAAPAPAPPSEESVEGAAAPAAGAAERATADAFEEPVVDVSDLAPDAPPAEDPIVDVADLAPDAPGAEDPVVDVADLAPDAPGSEDPVVDVADLAPDAPGGGREEGGEGGGDAFSRWLNRIR